MSNSKVVGALILGAAAGAAISLYLTSEKGIEFKQMLAEKTKEIVEDLKTKANETKDMVNNLSGKVVAATENAAQEVAGSVISKAQSNMYI